MPFAYAVACCVARAERPPWALGLPLECNLPGLGVDAHAPDMFESGGCDAAEKTLDSMGIRRISVLDI